MHTVFWDYADIIQQECMIGGTEFDWQTFVKSLKRLEVQISHFCCSKSVLLQHDNFRAHTLVTTSVVILNIRFDVVLYPPYSQNLAPSAN